MTNILDALEPMGQLIDAIIRGGGGGTGTGTSKNPIPYADIAAKRLYKCCTSLPTTNQGDAKLGTEVIEATVSLFNQAQKIPASASKSDPRVDVIRAYVLVSAGILIRLYCTPSSTLKSAAKSILFISKGGVDLHSCAQSADEKLDAQACCKEALRLYHDLPENALTGIISTSDIEEIKTSIYNLLLYMADTQADPVGYVREASILVQEFAAVELNIQFIKRVIAIAVKSTHSQAKDKLTQASTILKLCLCTIDAIKLASTDMKSYEALTHFRANIFLLMIGILQRLEQYDQALSCVQQMEELLLVLKDPKKQFHSFDSKRYRDEFVYAKFSTLLKKVTLRHS